MKTSMLSMALAISLLSVGVVWAAEAAKETKTLTGQQNKMVTCNAQAKEKALKGHERETFMSDCLKAEKPGKAALTPQQQKMKDCNKQATGKKGDERKAFLKGCLSGAKS